MYALGAHYRGDHQRVAGDAGTALEHLTKACLASRSPALLADLKSNNWATRERRTCRVTARPFAAVAESWRDERIDTTFVVQGKDRHGSGNHGDPEFRTQAQREPHRKLGVNWEWSNALAHNLLLTRKVVRREGIEPPTR